MEESEVLAPSKSQLKRQDAALQDLARELSGLSKAVLNNMQLPESVFDAICMAAAMPSNSARKRQTKFVGSLLRKMDVEPIRETLAKLKNQGAHAAREHHQTEQWRDRLLSEDRHALTDCMNRFPQADSQQIRQLIRNSKKESATGKPPKSSRLLFKYLRGLVEMDC